MARGNGHDSGPAASPRRLTVEFEVPVLCEVNLSTGKVEKVIVFDEEVSLPGKVSNRDGSPAPVRLQGRAKEIATDQPWPAWEFGV